MGRFGSMFKKSEDKEKPDDAKPQANPYASNPYANNPYTQQPSGREAYTQAPPSASQGLPTGPRSGLPSGPRPGGRQVPSQNAYYGDSPTGSDSTAPPPYSSGSSTASTQSSASSKNYGYGNDKLGAAGGYGSRRFEEPSDNSGRQQHPPQRQGGYGGLGGGDRDALFASRPGGRPAARLAQEEPTPVPDWRANQHNMTQEEIDEAEITDGKGVLKDLQIKTERALDQMIADLDVAHSSVDATNASLDRQGEMLQHTRVTLNEANVQNRIGTANVKDLDDANKSMFNFVAASRNRRAKMNDQRLQDEAREKDEREQLKREIRESRKAGRTVDTGVTPARTLPRGDPSRFLFEDLDGEQAEGEDRIADKQEMVYHRVLELQGKIIDSGKEVDRQTQMIKDVDQRVDKTQYGVRKNTLALQKYD